MGTARVDTSAVRAIAREYDTAASIVDGAVRIHLGDIDFGGAAAGRAHVAHGDAVRYALFGVIAALHQWSRAATEIATALRVSADRYQDADLAASQRVSVYA